jgi:hypothetical protein
MRQADLKHELAVNRNSWFIRFYVWLWQANPKDINFCKIFWGYVFVIAGLVLRLVVLPIGDRLCKRLEVSSEARYERVRELKKDPEKEKSTGPSRMQRVLSSIADVFSRIVFALGSAVAFVSERAELMKIVYAAALLLGLATSGAIVWVAVVNFSTTWIVLVVFGGFALGVVTIAGLDKIGVLDWIAYKIFRRLGLKTKSGALGFFSVLRIGLRSVKTNTCPRIVLKESA